MTDIVLEIIGLKSDDSTGNNDTVSDNEGQTAVIYYQMLLESKVFMVHLEM